MVSDKVLNRILSNRGTVEKRIVGALKSCIDAHGPIGLSNVSSAAKRIWTNAIRDLLSGRVKLPTTISGDASDSVLEVGNVVGQTRHFIAVGDEADCEPITNANGRTMYAIKFDREDIPWLIKALEKELLRGAQP